MLLAQQGQFIDIIPTDPDPRVRAAASGWRPHRARALPHHARRPLHHQQRLLCQVMYAPLFNLLTKQLVKTHKDKVDKFRFQGKKDWQKEKYAVWLITSSFLYTRTIGNVSNCVAC